MQHFCGVAVKDGFRINLGLYNGTDEAVVHRLLVYDSAGIEVARREITLGPRRVRLRRQVPDQAGQRLRLGRAGARRRRKHGTFWGGSSNHGDDYGVAW